MLLIDSGGVSILFACVSMIMLAGEAARRDGDLLARCRGGMANTTIDRVDRVPP